MNLLNRLKITAKIGLVSLVGLLPVSYASCTGQGNLIPNPYFYACDYYFFPEEPDNSALSALGIPDNKSTKIAADCHFAVKFNHNLDNMIRLYINNNRNECNKIKISAVRVSPDFTDIKIFPVKEIEVCGSKSYNVSIDEATRQENVDSIAIHNLGPGILYLDAIEHVPN